MKLSTVVLLFTCLIAISGLADTSNSSNTSNRTNIGRESVTPFLMYQLQLKFQLNTLKKLVQQREQILGKSINKQNSDEDLKLNQISATTAYSVVERAKWDFYNWGKTNSTALPEKAKNVWEKLHDSMKDQNMPDFNKRTHAESLLPVPIGELLKRVEEQKNLYYIKNPHEIPD